MDQTPLRQVVRFWWGCARLTASQGGTSAWEWMVEGGTAHRDEINVLFLLAIAPG